jgi:hypothetical protein
LCIVGEPEDDQEELLAAVNAARSAIGVHTVLLFLPGDCQASLWIDVYNFLFFSAVGAYSGPFWKKMEPMLTFISSENLSFLKNQVGVIFALDVMIECAFIVGWDGV